MSYRLGHFSSRAPHYDRISYPYYDGIMDWMTHAGMEREEQASAWGSPVVLGKQCPHHGHSGQEVMRQLLERKEEPYCDIKLIRWHDLSVLPSFRFATLGASPNAPSYHTCNIATVRFLRAILLLMSVSPPTHTYTHIHRFLFPSWRMKKKRGGGGRYGGHRSKISSL